MGKYKIILNTGNVFFLFHSNLELFNINGEVYGRKSMFANTHFPKYLRYNVLLYYLHLISLLKVYLIGVNRLLIG